MFGWWSLCVVWHPLLTFNKSLCLWFRCILNRLYSVQPIYSSCIFFLYFDFKPCMLYIPIWSISFSPSCNFQLISLPFDSIHHLISVHSLSSYMRCKHSIGCETVTGFDSFDYFWKFHSLFSDFWYFDTIYFDISIPNHLGLPLLRTIPPRYLCLFLAFISSPAELSRSGLLFPEARCVWMQGPRWYARRRALYVVDGCSCIIYCFTTFVAEEGTIIPSSHALKSYHCLFL